MNDDTCQPACSCENLRACGTLKKTINLRGLDSIISLGLSLLGWVYKLLGRSLEQGDIYLSLGHNFPSLVNYVWVRTTSLRFKGSWHESYSTVLLYCTVDEKYC